jgi:hypothetical protein
MLNSGGAVLSFEGVRRISVGPDTDPASFQLLASALGAGRCPHLQSLLLTLHVDCGTGGCSHRCQVGGRAGGRAGGRVGGRVGGWAGGRVGGRMAVGRSVGRQVGRQVGR